MEFIPVCEPFLNGRESEYVQDCMTSGWISSTGKYVSSFEEKFAEFCGAKYAVAVSNGTVALHLALIACDLKSGDEVVIPNFTMIASAFAICYTGAIPVFIDVDPNTWNIDVSKIESRINSRTKAIMPVSIFGQPCDMDFINNLAKKHNLLVIEDAAESHGAIYKGSKTGNLADITTFSFFANKNLTTGEGGMVVTNDVDIYSKLRYFKNLCFPLNGPREYIHNDIGFNYRMSNIHAAIGCAQLEKADEYIAMRIQNALMYRKLLKDVRGIIFQKEIDNVKSVYWMNTILVNSKDYGHTRDELIEYLKSKLIETRLLFVGMHRQPSLIKYGCSISEDYSVTDYLTHNGLYLPSASNLSQIQIEFICNQIINFSKNS